MNALRNAKNIVFVGYSLPDTDIYMQYFFKSGLGPNNNLNKIFIFDPIFQSITEESKKMEERFLKCFSHQLHQRIHFIPKNIEGINGDFNHFVKVLYESPESILF